MNLVGADVLIPELDEDCLPVGMPFPFDLGAVAFWELVARFMHKVPGSNLVQAVDEVFTTVLLYLTSGLAPLAEQVSAATEELMP